MLKLPEVGDTIVIRGVVKEITQCYDGPIISYLDTHEGIGRVFASRIVEIIPKPWEPKVGDHVRINNSSWNGFDHTAVDSLILLEDFELSIVY